MNLKAMTEVYSDGKSRKNWFLDGLLILVILAAIFFRVLGLFWGEYQYLHPDERFLVWVGTDISPVKSMGEYFDTANSSLNPHNRGHGFYVYGTLPMFLTRYVVEGVFGHSGFLEMTQAGRSLSALADVITVMLVYLVARLLYDKRVGVLAAAFSAAVVLQIQQSHFFTMDTFITMFSFLAIYFAAKVSMLGIRAKKTDRNNIVQNDLEGDPIPHPEKQGIQLKQTFISFVRDPLFLPSLGFGIALGMAVASKIIAAPVALTLPVGMLIYLLSLSHAKRPRRAIQCLIYLVLAALVSLLVFRIFQPYAFSGPSFFGLKLNPQWVNNILEQRAQSGRNVDFPPAMQWARRPIWFSLQNMVFWGLGLPLGLLAWAGFIWAGWRIISPVKKGGTRDGDSQVNERFSHALIWGWTAFYFIWQSLQLNPTMRYQLPIYPTLVIFAAWALVSLYDLFVLPSSEVTSKSRSKQASAFIVGGIVLLTTYAYAIAFSQIYTKPITRVEASRWIYQNIPGPIVLPIQTSQGTQNQIIPFPYNQNISPGVPYTHQFQPKESGTLSQVILTNIEDKIADHRSRKLDLSILEAGEESGVIAKASLIEDFSPSDPASGSTSSQYKVQSLNLDQSISLDPDKSYILQLALPDEKPEAMAVGNEIVAYINPATDETGTVFISQTLQSEGTIIRPNTPLTTGMKPVVDGVLMKIGLEGYSDQGSTPTTHALRLHIQPLGESNLDYWSDLSISNPSTEEEPEVKGIVMELDSPILVIGGKNYILTLEVLPEGGSISISGMKVANEGEWDDGLPLRMDGYDGFGGIYPSGLDLNMYWDDNPEKLDRFLRILDEANYLFISSNRQWGTLPRLPERFPMTSIYYRDLLGCPEEYSIEYCYRIAEPGIFEGKLGYELIKVFTSEPKIGPIRLNDQFAEEAFTVYDHPKVFIFKKSENYDPEKTRAILGSVDFSQVIRVPPMQAGSNPENLMLPAERLTEQRQGGTWSDLFKTDALQNRFQIISVILWYLSLSLIGLLTYPLLRQALPGLLDRGYPLARTVGLLLLSYLVWLTGSFRIPFSRSTISIALLFMVILGIYFTYRQREELSQELRSSRKYYLIVEGITLFLFLLFLLIRFGNPDLWHPWKGGEKPMDFSYFNAVLKSTSFPPYDPWYAGGYLNYYYYGFVFMGVLVKWLGIVPSVAYNLILPTLFSMIAMGAFSLVWNISQKAQARRINQKDSRNTISPYVPAVAGALGMAILGNLGTVRMFYQGFQKLIAPGGIIEGVNFFTRQVWAIQGFVKVLLGANLPYGLGDWYWNPSRVIPALGDVEPITEFPYFTALYGDPHAHLFALPITLVALAFCAAIVLGKARWKNVAGGLTWFLLASLAIGSLRPTNTWDLPVYLALGILAVGYAIWKYFQPSEAIIQKFPFITNLPKNLLKLVITISGMLLLTGFAILLFQPYAQWYALGYSHIDLWKGTRTSISAYLTHWGLFLFLIVSWMIWETRDWLAKTPLSKLRDLRPYRSQLFLVFLLLILTVIGLLWYGVPIAWLALCVGCWAGILIFRPDQPDAKKLMLFLVGTGLVMTLMVEVIVLRGDVGRMNWVFKFYLQVWTFFAIISATSLGWVIPALPDWKPGWRIVWQAILIFMIAGSALYTIMATMAKIEDRMAENAPHTLDGMAFIPYSTYTDTWGTMDLSQDYRAIRWMQENVTGSPVIVEANLRDLYRWGSRFSIYTGLPGVVGWEWHQQQQRAVVPGSWISERISEIDDFYLTTDVETAKEFLRKYDVRYIIVGQQELGNYPGAGLEKFEDLDGYLWREVYRDLNTVIYEVLP